MNVELAIKPQNDGFPFWKRAILFFYVNFGKRLVKMPKIYFYDSGLACHLLKIKLEDLAHHPNRGNLFEGLVISEIIKRHYNLGEVPHLYFWRDKTGHEVDCILAEGQNLVPIEIKSSRTAVPQFFEGLTYWNNIAGKPQNNGFVVFAGASQQIRGYKNLISWQSIEKIFEAYE